MIYGTPSFSKSSVFQTFFIDTYKANPAFSNSFGSRTVFEKLRFRDGLVWTVGLTVEIKLRFQIPRAKCGQGLTIVSFLGSPWCLGLCIFMLKRFHA